MSLKVLVCDLDNTLYDWVGYFVPAFYAMVDKVVDLTGCDRDQLLDDFRAVHQHHHDSEHPYSLLETATVKRLYFDRDPVEIIEALDPAFHAFNRTRKDVLRLYPAVRNTLETLQAEGVRLVAHTESKLYAAVDRLTRLELTQFFEHIYCRERSASLHPDPGKAAALLADFPMDKVVELSMHQRKPDPAVLLEICERNSVAPQDTAYVGDSMARDMLMAKRAGVMAIWARYGTEHDPGQYERLVRITHWTQGDVEREARLKAQAATVTPDHILASGFFEVLDVLRTSVGLTQSE